MKKSKLLFPLMIILTLFVVTLSACNKTYDNEKEWRYNLSSTIDVSYDAGNNKSNVVIHFFVYNIGSATLKNITIDCAFLDNSNVQLDRQKNTYTLDLKGYSTGNYFLSFENVSGYPSKASVLNTGSAWGLTEQEQHDADIQARKDKLANNWWIWVVISYVIIGIIIGFLCASFTCADFDISDEDMWISIVCGIFWPIGGIMLLIMFLSEEGLLLKTPPIKIKFWYIVDGKRITLKGKGFSYHEAYDQLSLKELQLICNEEGITNYQNCNKEETISLIMEYMQETDDEEFGDEKYQELIDDEFNEINEKNIEPKTKSIRNNNSNNKSIPKIFMKDIAGLKEAKEAFNDRVILPIKHRDLFEKYGKTVGGGILLYGLPGTGKTMFAQAVANELNAKFFSIKCSDIMSKWYGESESNIKQLFTKAKNAPIAVIFFDEFEAIGRKRTSYDTENGINTVQEILAQMQGIEKNNNILLVLAATNCPWDIDSALLRPGRFNDKIYIPLPDLDARLFIIKKVLQNVTLSDEVSITSLAESLEGYNCADVVEFCEQIKLIAIKTEIANKTAVINANDIANVKEKVHTSILQSDIERMEAFKNSN
ncbi:MAG: ATP-binding protein [Clostridium sp.]|nr:ATP-binding protein [Clostridium sp.]